MKKKSAVLGVFALLAAFALYTSVLVLHYRALRFPGSEERLLSFLEEIPPGIFYPLFIALVMLAVAISIKLLDRGRWERLTTALSMTKAKRIALTLWRVEAEPVVQKGLAVVRLVHYSFSNNSLELPVRSWHPDFDTFRQLHQGDTVEFEQLEARLEPASAHDLSGFLRVKVVS